MQRIKYIGRELALFIAHKMRDELIFNMAKLEGNTLTFAETQTVIHGISVAGKRMSELHQIEHIRDGWDEIIRQVESNRFGVDKDNFILINSIVARGENPQLGQFRTRPVSISGTEYMPPLPMLLSDAFRNMSEHYHRTPGMERAFDLFLDTARNQYFADGNKRTGQLMMNGELMSRGYAPITISPKNETRFHENLIGFYESGEKPQMIDFLIECLNDPRYAVMQQAAEPESDWDIDR
ncbi:Fic family protein [Paralysiella testudinis]|uniref:Fic family protein n=1 Tax=Paralysiella testudinis TaxID=2809020 RepID=A0A892ZI14_9NEIS|nr:Fic family protein [Paralysiella testudinis]QRQ82831.1 Fic family protein [Paralysiella testudinis]